VKIGLQAVMVAVLVMVSRSGSSADAVAPRLAVKAFLANPEFSDPRLSPDGKQIALLMSRGDEEVVVARDTEGEAVRPIGRISTPRVRLDGLYWANSNRIFVFVEEHSPFHVGLPVRIPWAFAIDADGTHGGTLKFGNCVQATVLRLPQDQTKQALIQCTKHRELYPGAYLLDVNSWAMTQVLPPHPAVDVWFSDHDGVVRAGEGHRGERYSLYARVGPKDNFEKIQDFNVYTDKEGFRLAGFSFDPSKLYVWKIVDGRRAVFEFDLVAKQLGEPIFEHATVDAAGLIFDKLRRQLVGVTYVDDDPKRHFLSEEAEREQMAIDRALPGTYNEVVSVSRDQTRAIIERSGDTQPPEYYVLTRDTQPKRLFFLLALYPQLRPDDLAPMHAVSYRARDGLTIPAYLTVPKGIEAKNLPVIVHPHGGPAQRDYRHYDPEVQFLANRGFAVFQMNFRGSSGYGETYREGGDRQWGMAMQDDITDGVKWLIEQGIADPERIGIFGSSYGGYAALMALVKTPELFRAGASYAGVTSLPRLLADDQWYRLERVDQHRIGGGWSDSKRLHETSPLDNVAKIRAPVLLAHGENDERVHVRHARMMAKALRSAGKDVEYLEFANEVHGLLLEENRLHFYERLGEFFDKHLAPRPRSAGEGER